MSDLRGYYARVVEMKKAKDLDGKDIVIPRIEIMMLPPEKSKEPKEPLRNGPNSRKK